MGGAAPVTTPRFAVFVIAALAFAGCTGNSKTGAPADEAGNASSPSRPSPSVPPVDVAPQVRPGPPVPGPPIVRFIAWGDVGMGNDRQRATATAALEVCRVRGCDFVVQLGDNIYEMGAESANDPQFESKFEEPYRDFTIPFWVALGNHDSSLTPHGDGLSAQRAEAEVDYHYRPDRPSEKWRMPHRYYAFQEGHVAFFALDTNAVNAGRETAGVQAAWLDASIPRANATWKIAFGHHPIRSNGAHGNAGSGDPTNNEFVKAFLEKSVCGKADVYLAGHDHDLQWLAPTDACKGTTLIVSGAGAAPREEKAVSPASDENDAWFERRGDLGFFWIEVRGSSFTGEAYDGKGKLLFARTIEK